MKNILKKIFIFALIFLTSFSFALAAINIVPNGGTGVGTITGVPYGTGTSPLSIVTMGSGVSFIAGTLSATGVPAGANTQIQFNDNGAFGGNSGLTYDKTTSVLTATNPIVASITGNAATVTTNANLTGPITSVGNATSIASQTGTGTTFVMDASPTITSLTATSGSGNIPITITGVSSGVGISANSVTSGTAMRANNITTGIGLEVTASTIGIGLNFNVAGGNTTASALVVTGSNNITANYTGAYIQVTPSRQMTAAATRNMSGQMMNINPTYSITGTNASVYNQSGAVTQIARTISNASSNASSSLNVSGAVLDLSNTLGTATNAVVDTGNILKLTQNNTTASGTVLNIINSGTGAIATFSTGSTEILRVTNTLLTFGGTTSSFPALKRSSAILALRLADDSADASFSAAGAALSGKITTYNGVTTAGQGVPSIYGFGRSTAQTAAVASVATYTVGAADSSFTVSANVNVTTSVTHSFSVQVDYTDETNTAQTLTLNVQQLAGTVITAITNITGTGPYEGIPTHIRCKAGTAITIKTTGTFTSVTYNVEGAIIKIG